MSAKAGESWTALVLAGSRGPADPVASHCGVRHKALAPVAGEPMLGRVLETLAASRNIGRIVLCVEAAEIWQELPKAVALEEQGRLRVIPAAGSPSLSVGAALESIAAPYPLLVTTADHPLLTTAMIDHFCAAAADADIAVALAPATLVRREHPGAVRTFYRFGREAYSGCNLFAFLTPRAVRAAEFWTGMERYRKRPWRLIAAVGPATLLRFALGLLNLGAAERLLSRRLGIKARFVEMPFAEAAIDVDKPADLSLAEAILARRGQSGV